MAIPVLQKDIRHALGIHVSAFTLRKQIFGERFKIPSINKSILEFGIVFGRDNIFSVQDSHRIRVCRLSLEEMLCFGLVLWPMVLQNGGEHLVLWLNNILNEYVETEGIYCLDWPAISPYPNILPGKAVEARKNHLQQHK